MLRDTWVFFKAKQKAHNFNNTIKNFSAPPPNNWKTRSKLIFVGNHAVPTMTTERRHHTAEDQRGKWLRTRKLFICLQGK